MWAMTKRFLLFSIVNILVLTTMMISWNIISAYLGIEPSQYSWMLGLCLAMGMGGAFISLLMSKKMAKWMMKVKIIDPRTNDTAQRELVETVHRMAKAAKLPKMPEVGIYQGQEINAFATGPSKKNSLVAVSTGLLQRMDKGQVEGVLAHEVAHIANGDMVTMTLLQGIVNTLVLFLSRIIASAVANNGDDDGPSFGTYFMVSIALQIVFSILGSVVVNYFSRAREYRADIGGARYAGKDKMISALKALAGTENSVDKEHQAIASLKISGRQKSALAALFSTHPPLEDRIRQLERNTRI